MNRKILGLKAKQWRKENTSYTQHDMARLCNVSRETISAFESGRSRNLDILMSYISLGFKYNMGSIE